MAYGSAHALDVDGTPLWQLPAARFDPAQALLRNPVPQPAAFMRTSALRSAGGLDESLHMTNDLELWLRLARYGALKHHARRVWAGARLHRQAKTFRDRELSWEEMLRLTAELLGEPGWSGRHATVLRARGYAHWFASMSRYRVGDIAGAREHLSAAT